MTRMHGRNRGGFTLIELMAVVVIIVALLALVIGMAGIGSKKGDEARVVAEFQRIGAMLDKYRYDMGTYPKYVTWQPIATNNVFAVLTNHDSKFSWPASFNDPWGNSYMYKAETNFLSFRLWSKGPDSSGNNTNLTDDMYNDTSR